MESEILIAVLSALTTGGTLGFIQFLINRRDKKQDLLLGLAHDRIIFLCKAYIEQGWISPEELDDLNHYLVTPYVDNGGNGTAEALFEDVKALPKIAPSCQKSKSEKIGQI